MQLDWIVDSEKGWEKWRNFDNLPEGYKAFLKRENDFRIDSAELTNGQMYTYSVKYWENTDTYSVIRWKKKSGSGTGSWKKPANEYTFTRVEEGSADDINEIAAMGNASGEKWKYEGFVVLKRVVGTETRDEIVHIISKQDKMKVKAEG